MKKLTPEGSVKQAVVSQLNFYGWMTAVNLQGIGAISGRPDLEAYKRGFTLFIEFKAPEGVVSPITGRKSRGGKLRKGQPEYHQRLRDAGMTIWLVDDSEKFLEDLERLEFELWGLKSRRIS
jgi:hypothetical protein